MSPSRSIMDESDRSLTYLMMIALLLLLYVVTITLMKNHVRGTLLARIATLSLSLQLALSITSVGGPYGGALAQLTAADGHLLYNSTIGHFILLLVAVAIVLLSSSLGSFYRSNPITVLLV